jgi:hypothetical protein
VNKTSVRFDNAAIIISNIFNLFLDALTTNDDDVDIADDDDDGGNCFVISQNRLLQENH